MNTQAWNTVRQCAQYLGRGWVNIAASESLLGPTLTVSQARAAQVAYGDWKTIAKHARLSSRSRVAVDVEWLAAMCWYSNAIEITPDYWRARVHRDPRVRELSLRDRHRYGPVFAPYIEWSALESAPTGGRWDEARWVSLLAIDGDRH